MSTGAEERSSVTPSPQRLSTLTSWRVVGASVCGTSHEKVKQLCQDAHYWKKLSETILVAAVADGAGSAMLGKVGAIVAAQTAIETVCLRAEMLNAEGILDLERERGPLHAHPTLSDGVGARHIPKDEEDWKLLLTEALAAAKTSVEAEAIACEVTARDLATTLIIAIAAPELVAVAQVGDGVAVVGDVTGNLIALTTPQGGEYVNQTTFLVSPNALETAQVSVWHGTAANVAILSDGLQMLALKSPSDTPHKPFFSPLFNFVADVTNEAEAKEQLAAFLRSDRLAERTDDDLTLLLATLL